MADEIVLTPRARHMALWLCDLSHPGLDRRSRDASCELLLRELPDFWTAEEAVATSAEVRMKLGPKAALRSWLTAMHWLVGEEERLPERPELPSRHAMQHRVRDMAERLLRELGPVTPRRKVPAQSDELQAWARRTVEAVRKQGHGVEVDW